MRLCFFILCYFAAFFYSYASDSSKMAPVNYDKMEESLKLAYAKGVVSDQLIEDVLTYIENDDKRDFMDKCLLIKSLALVSLTAGDKNSVSLFLPKAVLYALKIDKAVPVLHATVSPEAQKFNFLADFAVIAHKAGAHAYSDEIFTKAKFFYNEIPLLNFSNMSYLSMKCYELGKYEECLNSLRKMPRVYEQNGNILQNKKKDLKITLCRKTLFEKHDLILLFCIVFMSGELDITVSYFIVPVILFTLLIMLVIFACSRIYKAKVKHTVSIF